MPGRTANLARYPNPAPGAATLPGATPGATVQVLATLGRVAATAPADATGAATLALLAGFYVVRAGKRSAWPWSSGPALLSDKHKWPLSC